MNWPEFAQAFESEAARSGLSEDRIRSLLAYAEPLARSELPIVFNTAHLSAILGLEESTFRNSIDDVCRMYYTFRIVKKSGGYRTIDQPVKSLAVMQRWILRSILDRRPVHPAATAFCRGRSILDNARPHVRKPKVLTLDLHDFFGSVRRDSVCSLFLSLGYSEEVASVFARMTCIFDRLPQGAPTSPALSNLVFVPIDESLSELAAQSGLSYSRYADDLCFSGTFRVGRHIAAVRTILARHGFRLNESKTRLMLPHQRQEVTGIVVNDRPRVPRSLRRRLRQEAYYIGEHGLAIHESRVGSLLNNRNDYLRGLAKYVRSIDAAEPESARLVELLGRIRFNP